MCKSKPLLVHENKPKSTLLIQVRGLKVRLKQKNLQFWSSARPHCGDTCLLSSSPCVHVARHHAAPEGSLGSSLSLAPCCSSPEKDVTPQFLCEYFELGLIEASWFQKYSPPERDGGGEKGQWGGQASLQNPAYAVLTAHRASASLDRSWRASGTCRSPDSCSTSRLTAARRSWSRFSTLFLFRNKSWRRDNKCNLLYDLRCVTLGFNGCTLTFSCLLIQLVQIPQANVDQAGG